MAKKNRKLEIKEPTMAEQAQEAADAAQAAQEQAEKVEAVKPEKPKVEWIVTPNGTRIHPGSVMASQYEMFTLPLEKAMTLDEIVDELCKRHPRESRERHKFTVRRRSASFRAKYGIDIGIDEKGRINTNIQGRAKHARVEDPAKAEARAKAKAEREEQKAAEKAARQEARAKAKAEKEAEKAAAKAAAEAAKADAAAKAKAVAEQAMARS